MSTDWKIPLADIDLGDEEVAAAAEVIRSRWLTMGPRTREFERSFARQHQVEHALAVTNCTAALHLAYTALGLGPGDEVIMPAMTFVATANAAVACGARIIFADILSENEPTIDPAHVETLITSRTRAIVVMHYAGYACRMDEILAIAGRHNLPVVEDCAHAPGVRYGNRYLGTLGAAGCFSFFSNKNITTGEGGMILTGDEALAERMGLLRSHGMTSGSWKRHHERPQGYDVVAAGYNYRIDEIRSAIGLIQLGKLERGNARRAELTARYRRNLEGCDGATVAFSDYAGESACHILPLGINMAERRTAIRALLTEVRVQTSHHYTPLHLLKYYREQFGYREGMLLRTEAFAAREITLPLFPTMLESDVDFITDVIQQG